MYCICICLHLFMLSEQLLDAVCGNICHLLSSWLFSNYSSQVIGQSLPIFLYILYYIPGTTNLYHFCFLSKILNVLFIIRYLYFSPRMTSMILTTLASKKCTSQKPPQKHHAARSASQSSVLILLDLSKAFGYATYKTFLSVLTGLGVSGPAWGWFASYMDEGTEEVTWRGSTSSCIHHLHWGP